MIKASKTEIKKLSLSPHIDIHKRGKFEWVNITDTGSRVLKYLEKDLKLIQEDIEYITLKNPRAKMITRDNYLLVTMRFPYLRKQDNTIHSTHIAFIVSSSRVTTLHHNKLEALRTFENDYQEILAPANILSALLEQLYASIIPLTETISAEIDTLEEKIYKSELANAETVKKIFTIDRKVIDYRRVVRSHLWQTERLVDLLLLTKPKAGVKTNLLNVKAYPSAIWNSLESQMEAIDSMQSAYESLTSYRLNDIIRILTIISIVIAPMTLITGIFGMNFRFIPFAFHPLGFLYAILIMGLISLWAILYFRKKNWL